jgi:hypothetical protein
MSRARIMIERRFEVVALDWTEVRRQGHNGTRSEDDGRPNSYTLPPRTQIHLTNIWSESTDLDITREAMEVAPEATSYMRFVHEMYVSMQQRLPDPGRGISLSANTCPFDL